MSPPMALSREGIDTKTLRELAEACHVSMDEIEDVYPCTPLQIATMVESSIRSGASVFRYVLSLSPTIVVDKLCDALAEVASVNSILRTRLVDCDLGLVQVVVREIHTTERVMSDEEQYLRNAEGKTLGLGEPLFRSVVVGGKLALTMHHAMMDHATIDPLLRDMMTVYHGGSPEPHAPFRDFVAHCMAIDEVSAKAFWTSRFKGAPAVFPKVDPTYVPLATQKTSRKLSSPRIGDIIALAHVPSFIEAAWALTAAVYAGSDNVAFGLVLSGRIPGLAVAETTLGPTIAIVPVQVTMPRNTTVEGILRDRTMARRQLQTHAALQYGVPNISSVSEAARTASGFQTLLNIRRSLSSEKETSEIVFEKKHEPHGAFGLSLACDLVDGGVQIEAASDPNVICENQLQRVINQFEHFFLTLLEVDSQTKLDHLPRLNAHDRLEISHWNEAQPVNVERQLHDLFRDQARTQPYSPAVEASDGSVTYQELDELSDRLAGELRRQGVSSGSAVGFIFEKSLWTIVSVLAILKSSGTCVPIEKSDPRARKSTIISSSAVKLVLTSAAEYSSSEGLVPIILPISASFIAELPEIRSTHESIIGSPETLAYIMFTSGSTGTPKGVMLEHRNLASSLTCLAQRFGWGPGSRILQFAAHVWDISMGEIFGALLFGGCLCIPSDEDRSSNLANFINVNNVNTAWLTPTVIRNILPDEVPGLKSLLSIGEPVASDAAKIWGKTLRLINGWGPCEASILSTTAELTPECPYPETIGRPINGSIWITLPGNINELAPIGAVGEILIQSPGVAKGYLNDKVKTAASFINPPSWQGSHIIYKDSRLYRSGDLAKYNNDGTICFIGRQDNQVKIRGQRFELGELESVLAESEQVRDVFTTTKVNAGRTELVSVISLSDPTLPQVAILQELGYHEAILSHLRSVRHYASSRLPSYMVPTIWLAVEQMPQTTSAKIDRVAIKEWIRAKNLSSAKGALDSTVSSTLSSPETSEERLLQSIWSSVLAIPERDIGRESSFIQLGGDSILAMRVASACRTRGLQIGTADLLNRKSLAVIAKLSFPIPQLVNNDVSKKAGTRNSHQGSIAHLNASSLESFETRVMELAKISRKSERESLDSIAIATDVQAMMLAIGQDKDKGYYVNFVLDFTPALDTRKLKKACEQVIKHHAILRTVFFRHNSTLYQAALHELPPDMVTETTGEPEFSISFREGDILCRFHLVSDSQECSQLNLEIHHALYDALSLELVFGDLKAAYSSELLSDGPQFYSWMSHTQSLDSTESLSFWKEKLEGSSMPFLVPPAKNIITHGNVLRDELRIQLPLGTIQNSFGTASSVMKAAWALVLSCALQTQDVVFGEVSSNRYVSTFPGIDQVRGPCVNYLPVREKLSGDMTLASLISQVHESSVSSLPHHYLGFRSIIKDCTNWPSWTRFSTALVYQNHASLGEKIKIGHSDAKLSAYGEIGDSADLWVIATPKQEQLEIKLCFSTQSLSPERIQWFSKSFTSILLAMNSDAEQRVDQVKAAIQKTTGFYIPPTSPAMPDNAYISVRSNRSREVVLQAWKEIELFEDYQHDDYSMLDCGADIVTALLLSEYYREHGYNVSVNDVTRCPSRQQQANLLELKNQGH